VLREVLELDPSMPSARELRRRVQESRQQNVLGPKIKALLKQAVEDLGNRKYAEAIGEFEAALRLEPTNREASERLEQARALLEQQRKAERLIEEAQQEQESGDLDRAFRALSEALQMDPANEQAARLLARVKEETERQNVARRFKEGVE